METLLQIKPEVQTALAAKQPVIALESTVIAHGLPHPQNIETARTPMIVVCSGAKIVLDLPATHEWLETNGITVVGYQCDEMPGFYSRTSGLPVDVRCDSPNEVVKLFETQRQLGMASALLVTVPVPTEAEVDAALLNRVLAESLAKAEREHITGRDLTPYLLARMAEQSEGATLRANIALLESNARVASQIARTLGDG